MFNLRLNIIIATVFFLLSFIIGLAIRSSFPMLLIRPLFFAVIAFILSMLITLLVNNFLPELLDEPETLSDPTDMNMLGSNINISEDTATVPEGLYARPDDSDDNIGNISDITSAVSGSTVLSPLSVGMDQNEQNGYNEEKEFVRESSNSFDGDGLPDLESLAGAFMPSSGDREEEEKTEYSTSDTPQRSVVGNKAHKMDIDFDAKDLAMGIRTILNKED